MAGAVAAAALCGGRGQCAGVRLQLGLVSGTTGGPRPGRDRWGHVHRARRGHRAQRRAGVGPGGAAGARPPAGWCLAAWRLRSLQRFGGSSARARPPPPAAPGAPSPTARPPPQPPQRQHGRTEIITLALAYGLAGFGYIITATFLPVIARSALPGSAWLDLFWPIVGLGVVAGALMSTRVKVSGDLRRALAVAYVLQAAGVMTPLWSPTLAGFVAGSVMLGLPFTAITFFAMQEVRRLAPLHSASMMGLLTALYGVGQIVGPPLAAWQLGRATSQAAGFAMALQIASGALVLGALIYLAMGRAFPRR
ncbi:MAG: YbfB/YjiJ family MFS transporter [Ideonella sp.]|nr:YbfB/YjiJ family MFS transporter [Ideonella sp.]